MKMFKVVIVMYVLLAVVVSVNSQPACTHYAVATGGTGSACSLPVPCTIQTFINSASLATTPGNVLCLNAGTYTGQVDVPTTFAGAPGNPIWIRALNEGQVTFNQGGSGFAFRTQGSWGVLWGVNIYNGRGSNLLIRGSNWVVQRVVAGPTASTGTEDNIVVAGSNNTIEDSAAFGVGGKQIAAGASQAGVTNNVIRRVWAVFNDDGDKVSPVGAMEQGYGQDTVTFENVLGTNNQVVNPSQEQGPFQTFRSDNSKVLGSIFYIGASDVATASEVFFALTDGGSAQGAGNYDPSDNNVFRHIVSFIHPSNASFATTRALRLNYQGPGPHGSGNVLSDSVGVGGVGISCQSPDYTCTNVQYGTSLVNAIGAGKSIWTESNAGPGICKRYINGVLTDEPLWPWPMNQRIIDFMTARGATPVDVTATMESLFGPIPAVCRSDAPVIPVTSKVRSGFQ